MSDDKYAELYENITKVQKDNDPHAVEWLVKKYESLINTIVIKLRKTFRFVNFEELQETTIAFFIQLVVEYDKSLNDNFTNYLTHKLYFRVKEFMCADYEQTDILHSRNKEDDGSYKMVEYCDDRFYNNEEEIRFAHHKIFDAVDYLENYLSAEEMDMFLCYYILCFTQEQMATIFGMTQCPINLKITSIAKQIDKYFKEYYVEE